MADLQATRRDHPSTPTRGTGRPVQTDGMGSIVVSMVWPVSRRQVDPKPRRHRLLGRQHGLRLGHARNCCARGVGVDASCSPRDVIDGLHMRREARRREGVARAKSASNETRRSERRPCVSFAGVRGRDGGAPVGAPQRSAARRAIGRSSSAGSLRVGTCTLDYCSLWQRCDRPTARVPDQGGVLLVLAARERAPASPR